MNLIIVRKPTNITVPFIQTMVSKRLINAIQICGLTSGSFDSPLYSPVDASSICAVQPQFFPIPNLTRYNSKCGIIVRYIITPQRAANDSCEQKMRSCNDDSSLSEYLARLTRMSI